MTRLGTLEVVQDETIKLESYGEREDEDDNQIFWNVYILE